MALSVDTSNSAITTGVLITGLTTSFTLGSTADLLVVGPTLASTATGGAVSSITYAAASLTNLAGSKKEQADGGGDFFVTDIWRKIAPATGANSMVTSCGGGVIRTLTHGWVSFIGSDQTTPLGAAVTNSGTGANGSVSITVASGQIGFACLCTAAGGVGDHSFADTTERWETDEQTQIGTGSNGATKPGSATTMTAVNGTGGWAISATAVAAAASGSVLTSAGVATMTGQGSSTVSVPLSSVARATVVLQGQSTATTVLTSAGVAAANLGGQSSTTANLSSAGASTVVFVGTSVNTTQAVLSTAGASTVAFTSSSSSAGAMTVSGSASVKFAGKSTGGSGVTLWGKRPNGELDRRKRIEMEDEELMLLVRNEIAPELLRRARLRH